MSTQKQHNRLDKIEDTAGAASAEIRVAYFEPTADEPDLDGDTPTFVSEERLDAWMDEAGTEDTNIVVRYGSEAADQLDSG